MVGGYKLYNLLIIKDTYNKIKFRKVKEILKTHLKRNWNLINATSMLSIISILKIKNIDEFFGPLLYKID